MIQTAKKLFWGWAILLSYAGVATLQTLYKACKRIAE